MDSRTEYSPGLTQPVSKLPVTGNQQELQVSLFVYLPLIQNDKNTLVVASFENRNKPYGYYAVKLNDGKTRPGSWTRVTLTAPVPAFFSADDLVKVYIWNPGKQLFYIDDLRVCITE
jgi:hypothetical protein